LESLLHIAVVVPEKWLFYSHTHARTHAHTRAHTHTQMCSPVNAAASLMDEVGFP